MSEALAIIALIIGTFLTPGAYLGSGLAMADDKDGKSLMLCLFGCLGSLLLVFGAVGIFAGASA